MTQTEHFSNLIGADNSNGTAALAKEYCSISQSDLLNYHRNQPADRSDTISNVFGDLQIGTNPVQSNSLNMNQEKQLIAPAPAPDDRARQLRPEPSRIGEPTRRREPDALPVLRPIDSNRQEPPKPMPAGQPQRNIPDSPIPLPTPRDHAQPTRVESNRRHGEPVRNDTVTPPAVPPADYNRLEPSRPIYSNAPERNVPDSPLPSPVPGDLGQPPEVGPVRNGEPGRLSDLVSPREGAELLKTQDKPLTDSEKKSMENWNKMLEDAGVPEGPYKDLMMEFGKQLISGNLDSAKLQDLMKTAHESDANHFAAWQSIAKATAELRSAGIQVSLDPKAWGINISDTIKKDEWAVSMDLEKDGKSTVSKRKFSDPEGKFPDALFNIKEDITVQDAFKHLSSKFKNAISDR